MSVFYAPSPTLFMAFIPVALLTSSEPHFNHSVTHPYMVLSVAYLSRNDSGSAE